MNQNSKYKFATGITETSEPGCIRKEARRLEFHRSESPPLKWELSSTTSLTTCETWDAFELTYTERRFFEQQQVPGGYMLLPQYAVRVNQWKTQRNEWRFVDFVLIRKGDLAPIIAFEIDGNSHDGRMVFDALRDIEIHEQLKCNVVHVANTKLQAKKIFAYVEHWHKKLNLPS